MRAAMMALVLVFGFAGGVAAQDRDVEATISAQIDAFLEDDFVRAFTFASPVIQGLFQTPDNFGVMVRRGYPMVWRPAEVRYLEQRQAGGATYQKVIITDGAGAIHLLEYEMVQLETGWKINGVQMLRPGAGNA